jgi:hypothetical protein
MADHAHLTQAIKDLVAPRAAYSRAAQFFEGTIPEVFASEKLREIFKDQSEHFRINYARTPVDLLAERTMVKGITCDNSAQQAALDQTWDDNQLGIEAKDVHLKAYEFGDSYIIGWLDDDLPGGVSLYQHEPTNVRVFYDPEKPRQKSHAVHSWLEPGDAGNSLGKGKWHRVNLYYPDRVEQWVSSQPHEDETGKTTVIGAEVEYVPFVDESGVWPLENPVPGVIPVFHYRTGRPYGRPEHADAYGPQEAINKLVLSMMGGVDHQVLPKRYIATDSALNADAPDPFAAAVGEAELDPEGSGLDSSSTMSDEPGEVWILSGKNVRPGQFPAADISNFTGPIEMLVQQMADVTDMPANRYHRGGTTPSGDSQRMDEQPLNSKVSDRQAQFGVTWHELFEWVCAVRGLGPTNAEVAWAPPITYNDRDSWETAKLQLEAGVPFAQVMLERGYDSELVALWPSPVAAAPATSGRRAVGVIEPPQQKIV